MPDAVLSDAILDSLTEGVFTVDKAWRITAFNRSAEEITGVRRTEALGQPCQDVLHSTLCENNCPIRQALANGKAVSDRRCHFVAIDGSRVPISVSAAALVDERGRVLGGVETFRDLSEVEALRSALQQNHSRSTSSNPAMQNVLTLVPVLAATTTSVLISGETGTGKEVIARAIHRQGERANKPFVAINCGALPENLLESELFGYKKGAFTGADRDKPGLIARAGDGTLFLDEIGEISLAMQVRLLRVLQEREFEPLGGIRAERLRARIIAASHRDLLAQVKSGQFRADLYYRLVVMRIEIPPLRERREDIPLLSSELLARTNLRLGSQVSGIAPDAMGALQGHDWPGNIRQLENVIERAIVLCQSERIELEHLPPDLRMAATEPSSPANLQAQHVRRQAEAGAILAALRHNGYRRKATAAQLGIHPTTLYRKIKALDLLSATPAAIRQR